MSRKLVYFDITGYSEPIRYMLHYGGLKFDDVRYNMQEWPIKEIKDSLPYGQLPIYEEDGRVLNQSIAIARYVASRTGLLPVDPWEQAKLDAAVLNIYDLSKKLATFFYAQDPEEKEKLKKQVLEDVDYYYSRFEKELHAGGGYFGGKLSWADFILVNTTELLNLQLNQTVNTKYPAITALISEIYANPGVKEYLATKKSSAPVS